MKDALERVVVPMFCNASIVATEEQKLKLEKLLKLWESKTNYLKAETLEKMRNPIKSYQDYQAGQMGKYANEVAALAQQTKITFEGYQAQHQAFVCHAMQQIMDLQQQKQSLEQQPLQVVQSQTQTQNPPSSSTIPLETIQASLQQQIQTLSQTPMAAQSQNNTLTFQSPPHSSENYLQINPSIPPPNLGQQNNINVPLFPSTPDLSQQPPHLGPNGLDTNPFTQPPPGYFPQSNVFPDFSKPPPGFLTKPEPFLEELLPTAPYYELPAGLMVPLVKVRPQDCFGFYEKTLRLRFIKNTELM